MLGVGRFRGSQLQEQLRIRRSSTFVIPKESSPDFTRFSLLLPIAIANIAALLST
jgi:hypothetical protein